VVDSADWQIVILLGSERVTLTAYTQKNVTTELAVKLVPEKFPNTTDAIFSVETRNGKANPHGKDEYQHGMKIGPRNGLKMSSMFMFVRNTVLVGLFFCTT
jgi:hypothetical protein